MTNIEQLLEKRNAELEKQLAAQNHEMEIESSLERVRTIAMGMNKPDDMLDVCSTIARQLELLKVKEIRNVQTAIFYKEKGTYMNYEYYAKHDKTLITETSFTNHEMHREFAAQMLKEKGEFFTTYISKSELPDWIAYQKTTNVFIDTYLETATSLSYYWHSLGPVALGISTYEPLKEEETNLFRRFLKVFELSYTRYLDIEQAIAQARESQIQLALERLRARTMAMHQSSELAEAASVMFEQLSLLGASLWICGFNICKMDNELVEGWICPPDGKIMDPMYIPYTVDQFSTVAYECWRNKGEMHTDIVEGTELQESHEELLKQPSMAIARNYIIENGIALPTWVQRFAVPYTFGYLMIVTTKLFKEPNILVRFAKVFDQTYTRFLDLQKAEAQARESQIQLALERVRARTMAMQKSEELKQVAALLFKQVSDLGIKVWTTGFKVWSDDNNLFTDYVTNPQGGFMEPYTIDAAQYFAFVKLSNAKKRGDEFYIEYEEGEQLAKTYEQLSKFGEQQFKAILDSGFQFPLKQYEHHVFGSKSSLLFITYDPVPEAHNIFKRFGKVFEQTYTRFLDLQKAEAQAREAQIQLALERVRARTMAMQKSDELMEAANLLFQQVQSLGIPVWTCGYNIWEPGEEYCTGWMSTHGAIQPSFRIPLTEHRTFIHMNESRLEAEPFYVEEVSGEALADHYRYMFSLPDFKQIGDKQLKDGFVLPTSQTNNVFNFKDGNLIFISAEPVPEALDIFKRFAKVFEQTYTRFLDLQKAEAQAREAQIEAALEKIRSTSLAMHHSEEITEVVKVLFEKLKQLGLVFDGGAGIHFFKEGSKDAVICVISPELNTPIFTNLPYDEEAFVDNPIIHDVWKAKNEGVDIVNKAYPFEQKNKYFQYVFKHNDATRLPQPVREFILNAKSYTANFIAEKNSLLGVNSWTEQLFSKFEIVILKRVARVFEQAYTRFLDLQKAEAQAKEAKIEATLERVRSKTMSMQKSDELNDVATLLFQQIKDLGIKTWTTGFNVWSDDNNAYTDYITTPKGNVIQSYTIDTTKFSAFTDVSDAKKRGEKFWIQYLEGDQLKETYKQLSSFGSEKQYEKMLEDGFEFPLQQFDHFVFGSKVSLMFITYEAVPEAHDIFIRFGKVFEQTYTRFLDLQKAEAQAREAKIEAALERVRSRTLAMQKSDELAETAAVLFKQLILLGVEPNRLYINIIKDETGEAEFWITDEDGSKVSMAYADNMNNNPSFKKMYDGWKQQKRSLVIDMRGKELQQYFKYLSSIHVSFKGGLAQKRRWQYIAYFNKGFIGMASPDEQHAETVHLLERFAYVFNLTFTRFNDLQIAEAHALQAEHDLIEIKAARKKAEETLAELQSTQQQLIQSEKMASLGELTAGIAHEIQNPLNFVNNFSEVNKELIDELEGERLKVKSERNEEFENEIISDLKQNLEKINHHGKRADAIVKGMLQHSQKSTGQKQLTDINALCDEYLRLSYHGLRAKDKSFNADFKTDFDESIGNINIIPQDIGRVLLNLYNNAFYAVNEKSKAVDVNYQPTVTVQTKKINNNIEITVTDNGNGIPLSIKEKIFQPFFTTKPTGQGTGLGLSLSYDIIKAHGGEIKVETKEGEGSEFIISLKNSQPL